MIVLSSCLVNSDPNTEKDIFSRSALLAFGVGSCFPFLVRTAVIFSPAISKILAVASFSSKIAFALFRLSCSSISCSDLSESCSARFFSI